MKTENTPEEKAKFFAQYWGQKVLKTGTYTYEVNSSFNLKHDAYFLELTPLKNISDEDAIEVASIRGFVNISRVKFVFEGYWVTLKQKGKRSVTKFVFFRDMYQPEIDFLRSKSYLLPYKDLSTEDLIAYGWAKES